MRIFILAAVATSTFAVQSCLAATSVTLETFVKAPLQSLRADRPFQMIAFDWWGIPDQGPPAFREAFTARREIHSGDTITVGAFLLDPKKSEPLTLIVDLAALPSGKPDGNANLKLIVVCDDNPSVCPVPEQQSTLTFNARSMQALDVQVTDRAVPMLAGRQTRSIGLPSSGFARVQLEVLRDHGITPVVIKAALVRGQVSQEILPRNINGSLSAQGAAAADGASGIDKRYWIFAGIIVLILILVGRGRPPRKAKR